MLKQPLRASRSIVRTLRRALERARVAGYRIHNEWGIEVIDDELLYIKKLHGEKICPLGALLLFQQDRFIREGLIDKRPNIYAYNDLLVRIVAKSLTVDDEWVEHFNAGFDGEVLGTIEVPREFKRAFRIGTMLRKEYIDGR